MNIHNSPFYNRNLSSYAKLLAQTSAANTNERMVAINAPIPVAQEQPMPPATYTGGTYAYTGIGIQSFGYDSMVKDWIQKAMNDTGVTLENGETLEVRLDEERKFSVSGLGDESLNKKFATALNNAALHSPSGKPSPRYGPFHTAMMFYQNSDYAMAAENEQDRATRARLIYTKDNISAQVKKNTGMSLDFSGLYRTDDGKIGGYPQEFEWYFECDLNKQPETREEIEKIAVARQIQMTANEFLDVGYDNIPDVNDLDVVFKFKQSDFGGFKVSC